MHEEDQFSRGNRGVLLKTMSQIDLVTGRLIPIMSKNGQKADPAETFSTRSFRVNGAESEELPHMMQQNQREQVIPIQENEKLIEEFPGSAETLHAPDN